MKYAFFGSPRFAAIVLEGLILKGDTPHSLVCNPDRPVGRKQILTPPPAKRVVLEKNPATEIFQPENKNELIALKDEIFRGVDVGILAAYGGIVPNEIIEAPEYGIVGAHPSLLPRYRGPTPIQLALLSGEPVTGTTLFLLDEEVDHGPVLAQAKCPIPEDGDYGSLEKALAELSVELLAQTVPKYISGNVQSRGQDETQATYTQKFKAEEGYVLYDDLKDAESAGGEKAVEIHRKIRALNPEPGVYTLIEGKRTKLLEADLSSGRLVLKKIQKEGKTPIDV